MTQKNSEFDITIGPDQIQKEYFKDLFRYRELLFFLSWRDLVVRYKQALIGISWSLIRPLLNMLVFFYIFGKVASLPSEGINYAAFILVGLLPWQFFSNNLADTSVCLVNQSSLISKIYFPRIILPISSIMANLFDFAVSFIATTLLVGIMGLLSWRIALLPLLFIHLWLLCLAVGIWTSAMMVRYRDIRFIIPFILQFGLFISPIGYGSFIISEKFRFWYYLNPMAGIINGFRWCFFGIGESDLALSMGLSLSITLILLYYGYHFFRKMERLFADII
jgi:lipopolysaccharide transport system permease protein